jgi:YHS domain-containing protein
MASFTVRWNGLLKNLKPKERNKMAIDPVCKMEVDEESAQWTSEYQGETYYFCAPGCKSSFDKDPEKYLQSDSEDQHHH